jgi:DNA mismatch repair protein MutL
MTIKTRQEGTETGTELCVEGGEQSGCNPAGCPVGTLIRVSDLFYNLPARRKCLSTDSTEFSKISDIVTSYALANPDVRVTLEHNDREIFATTGQGDLQSVLMSVYGRDVASNMIEVVGRETARENTDIDDDDQYSAASIDDISGLVSDPETTRSSRDYLMTFVNGRYIPSNTLREGIIDAYGNQLASDRYPFAVLNVEIPASEIDVNVHPAKKEVEFVETQAVRKQVQRVVRATLRDEGIIRTSAPRGRSQPDQTTINQDKADCDTQDDETHQETSLESPEEQSAHTPTDADGPTEEHSEGEAPPEDTEHSPITGSDIRSQDVGGETSSTSVSKGENPSSDGANTRTTDHQASSVERSGDGTQIEDKSQSGDESGGDTNQPVDATSGTGTSSPSFQPNQEQAEIDPQLEDQPGAEYRTLPALDILGQFDETYIIAKTEDAVLLIDQHAADERVHYERLREKFTGETTLQTLAEPVHISLTPTEAAVFEECEEALARIGFRGERDDNQTVEIRALPELVAESAGPELITDVLSAVIDEAETGSETVEQAVDELLADLACYPALTGNTSLTKGSMVSLLNELDACDDPWACPHGRPTVIELDRGEIEGRFERDYPGH